ncbi:sensor domain-containing diguanylate cyclase [Pararoseomonas indoligenes]|uniref:diguanylate cyclase n=1 Tax=Roseomonas indoligenes TaxID=2820811 RepID=A0A940MZG3_9PROT|nr:diguanylate cyclase [Pararoseomonas indoligenes]MBP0494468.1 diguanylate cyclase [Pararoseomonas indoligenes]
MSALTVLAPASASPERPPRTVTIAYALLFGASALLVPLTAWHEWSGREQRIEEVRTASSNLAHSLVRDAEGDFAMADVALVSMVEQLEADGAGPASLGQLSRLMRRQLDNQPELRNFSVYGADGALLLSSYESPTQGIGIADRDYFRLHREDPSPAPRLGTAVRSRLDGQWVVTLSRRFRNRDGRFGGVVVAAMEIGAVARGFVGFDLGEHGSITLVRDDGRVLARTPADEAALGAPILNRTPLRDSVAKRESGRFHFVSPIDGVDRIGAYWSGERFPLTVLVGRGTQDVLGAMTWQALGRIAVAALLAALLAFLGRRLIRHARQRRAAERTLADSEAQFRLLAEHASDMVSRIGPDGRIHYASPAAARLLGVPARMLLGRPLPELADMEDRPALQSALDGAAGSRAPVDVTCRITRPDGGRGWMETTLQQVRAGEEPERGGFVAVSRDVTERRLMQERMAELAATDGLTGLANRRRFDEALATEWRRAAREGTWLALLLLDVDRFKMFNDRYGHLAGDDALRAVARALEATIRRPADLAARYGGEEFAVILPVTDAAGAREVAEQARSAIARAGIAHEANESGMLTASIGVAAAQPDSATQPEPSILVAAADAALYEAKRTGRNRVVQAPSITVMQARRSAGSGTR